MILGRLAARTSEPPTRPLFAAGAFSFCYRLDIASFDPSHSAALPAREFHQATVGLLVQARGLEQPLSTL
jgi:hypothetical protein